MPSLPRVAFVNACEAGRVRGYTTTAAASFATGVYTRLAEERTLESAVTKSCAELLQNNEPDWANDILYGDGCFKLVVG